MNDRSTGEVTVDVFPRMAHCRQETISRSSSQQAVHFEAKKQIKARTTPTAMTMHAKSAIIDPMRVLRSKRAYVRMIMMTMNGTSIIERRNRRARLTPNDDLHENREELMELLQDRAPLQRKRISAKHSPTRNQHA